MNKLKFLLSVAALIWVASIGSSKANAWCDPGNVYCGTVIDSNVTVGHDDISRYKKWHNGPDCTAPGSSISWNGKAHVYRIYNPGDPFTVTLEWNDNPTTTRDDLILVLLEDCNAETCLGADPHQLEFSSETDTELPNDDSNGFWIIVDSRRDTTISYTLSIYCGDYPFNVELSSFSASRSVEGVDLSWSTASETENDRFDITRRELGTQDWAMVGTTPGHGTTSAAQHYNFTDRSVSDAGYEYQLSAYDVNGNMEVIGHATVEGAIDPATVVETFALLGNYPNPFNPNTNIQFSLATSSEVKLSVYDVQGRIVAELFNGAMEAGVHEIAFDASGLTSGVYFAQMSGSFGSDVMKMVLMK